jgi:hypothetical protein
MTKARECGDKVAYRRRSEAEEAMWALRRDVAHGLAGTPTL